MNFKKYNSIENSYREKYINAIYDAGYGAASTRYHVQEKVHGANMSIYCNGKIVKFASRNHMLADGEKFYGIDVISQDISVKVLTLWHMIQGHLIDKPLTSLIIYGELFGGNYPHKDVPKHNNTPSIQTGVFYSPDNKFIAFDMYVKLGVVGGSGRLIEISLMNDLLDEAGIMRCRSLLTDTLDKCLVYPNDNPSIIHTQLGLPPIDDNIMEGVVIKPEISCYLKNGTRVIIKNKNEKFNEKSRQTARKPKVPLRPHVETLITIGLCYVTENRYNNVLSHCGAVDYSDSSNIGMLIPMLVNDVMTDFTNENESLVDLSKIDRKIVQKAITNACKNLVLKSF